ncbi:MAG: putative signal transducing protein [Planctomycetota bacterium]
MDDKLITIAEFQNDIEAQMAKSLLQADGIDAIIVGQAVKDLLPVDGMLNVELQVFARDAQKAMAVLDSQQNQLDRQENDL